MQNYGIYVKIQDMNLIRRIQERLIKEQLKRSPVVAVVGPRQVGKTTLVKDLLGEKRQYYSFDDISLISVVEKSPLSFLTQFSKLTLDEIQKCPNVLSSIKMIVDEKRIPGSFLITGSANIAFLPTVSETLAGRITFVEVFPLTIFEILGKSKRPKSIEIILSDTAKKCWNLLNRIKPEKIQIEKFLFRGGFPPAWFEDDDKQRYQWFSGYTKTYIERDVRDLSSIRRLYDFQRFLSLTAFRISQIFNIADVSRDAGIPYTTAVHFFDLMLATFQVFLIQPYFANIGKRIIKSPKIIWNDTGLAMHLCGLNSWDDAERLGRSGFIIENKIAVELKTLLSVFLPTAKLYYWRTSGGAEVDLVVENNGYLFPIEVKWSEKISFRDTMGIQSFMRDFKNNSPYGIILYRGKNVVRIKENIFLVPFDYFLG